MMDNFKFDEILTELRTAIRRRLKLSADKIISEETERILKNVKILRTCDLTGEYWWNVEVSDPVGK